MPENANRDRVRTMALSLLEAVAADDSVDLVLEGSLEPFACFCVALRSVEVCLERTSTAFIEASLKPFASF